MVVGMAAVVKAEAEKAVATAVAMVVVTVAVAMAAAMGGAMGAAVRVVATAAVAKVAARVGTCPDGHPLAQHVRRRCYRSVACRIECCWARVAPQTSRRHQCQRSRRSRYRGSTARRCRKGRRESHARHPGMRRCWQGNCHWHPRTC